MKSAQVEDTKPLKPKTRRLSKPSKTRKTQQQEISANDLMLKAWQRFYNRLQGKAK